MERDDLIQQRNRLCKKLESNECLLREKEDEVFLQYERVVYLEEQCDKLKAEKEKYQQHKLAIEKEKAEAYKLVIYFCFIIPIYLLLFDQIFMFKCKIFP